MRGARERATITPGIQNDLCRRTSKNKRPVDRLLISQSQIRTMNIQILDENQIKARSQETTAPSNPSEYPLLTALDADAGVRDLHGNPLDEVTVTEKMRNAFKHCLVIVSFGPQDSLPADWEWHLRKGMDEYPGVRGGGVDYAYWSVSSEHPEFAIVLWAKEPNQSMPLTIRERLLWESGMREAFGDQRPSEDLILEVAEKAIAARWDNPVTHRTDSSLFS